ncbi:hypothetical protein FUA48_02885 [Flavobacterium alkalisoli]|uniref:Uncharacterized protein n=1 Tax=Flavobacterium alkalisoli TaxID=2602769 RepID=A0A5B9FMR9_9FLAO|nr:hypothetical protein [Flavobacterium alkalisoli]QEE48553.1 hypothetical protein FUA48_02885 [Flavobacterium alkalisoli]
MNRPDVLIIDKEVLRTRHKIIALIFMLTTVFFAVYGTIEYNKGEAFRQYFSSYAFAFVALFFVVAFLSTMCFKIDLRKNRFKEEYAFGPFKWGRWKSFPKGELDYVSLFKQLYRDEEGDGSVSYHINLWYKDETYFNLYVSDYDVCLALATSLAKKLNISLYDATDPQDKKWVEL